MTLADRFAARAGVEPHDLRRLVVEVSRIPYGRTSRRTASAVVDEWRGTCSTKHLLLAELIREVHPDIVVELWHRPYVVTPQLARSMWGDDVAASVPAEGLVDVHTFARLLQEGSEALVDVTVPLAEWDGASDTPLACGDGEDVPAGESPLESKERLVARRCDPGVREPFIAALAEALQEGRRSRAG